MGRIFNRRTSTKTHDFFEKYGNRALILARFVPIVRTFVTLVAGVGRMDFRKFIAYTAIGGILWVCGVTIARLLPRASPVHPGQHRGRADLDRAGVGDPDGVEFLLHRRRLKLAAAEMLSADAGRQATRRPA